MTDSPSIFIIAGPGGTSYSEKDVTLASENFKKTGVNVVSVGDGKRLVTLEDITRAQAQIKGEMTVFILAHGGIKGGQHRLELTEGHSIDTADLFKALATAHDRRKFDVFMASCHGGEAQEAADNILPKGSKFVDLSGANQETFMKDVRRFLQTAGDNKGLAHGDISAMNLMYDYLMTDLQHHIAPSITISRVGSYELEIMLNRHLGVPFTSEQAERAHATLDQDYGKERVDDILKKIASARPTAEMAPAYFGPALAVMFAVEDRSLYSMHIPKDLKLASIKLETQNAVPFDEGFNSNVIRQTPPSRKPDVDIHTR